MPLPGPSESKQILYNCDKTYLEELNFIRRRFDLVELTDVDTHEETEEKILEETKKEDISLTSVSSSPGSFYNSDPYDCNYSDLNKLNKFRQQLNVELISFEFGNGDARSSGGLFDRFCTFKKKRSRHNTRQHVKKMKERKVVEVLYSPPAKKICTRKSTFNLKEPSVNFKCFQQGDEDVRPKNWTESGNTKEFNSLSTPSEKSSPVPYKICFSVIHSPVLEQTSSVPSIGVKSNNQYCSLNVPDLGSEIVSLSPSVTIIENESVSKKKISLFESKTISCRKWNPSKFIQKEFSSLDVPRKSTHPYDFPILTNIYNWRDSFPTYWNSVDRNNQRFSRTENSIPVSKLEDRKVTDVDSVSTLNPMSGWNEKQTLDFNLYNNEIPVYEKETEIEGNQREIERRNAQKRQSNFRKKFKCLAECFGKRNRDFFK